MGIFEGITHSEEIEELLNDAQSMYDSATQKLEVHKESASKSLENLGKIKLNAWSGDMSTFLANFGAFANVQMKCIDDSNLDFLEKDLSPNQLMVNMRTASVNASEVLKAGALSIGTGALVGIASYGGVMMFAKASTGTAIATLSGVAKKNATLAWFGGGSLKAGGLGMLGGKVVLAGVVLAPIAIVAGTIAAAKGKEQLAEAQKVHAEAKKAVSQMNTVINGLEGIERISEGYIELLQGLSKQFRPFLNEMESIAKDYTPGPDGKIDFNQLSEMEQKTLHLSWLLAQLYYHSLSKPILTEDGKVDSKANSMLAYSQKEYRQLSLDVTNLASEKQKIKQTLDDAKKVFTEATKKLEDQRKKSNKYFVKQGKKNVQQWNLVISPFVETISGFENIDVNNILVSGRFEDSIDEAFEKIFAISDSVKAILGNTASNLGEISLIDLSLSGIHLLETSEEGKEIGLVLNRTTRSDTAKWLQSGINENTECVVADVLPSHELHDVQDLLNSITGKENLSSAEYISAETSSVVKLMDATVERMKKGQKTVVKQEKYLKRISRLLTLYKTEVEENCRRYGNTTTDFEQLSVEEQRVIQMACNLAKLYYCVADAKLFGAEDDLLKNLSVEDVLKEAKKEIKALRKTTYRMTGDNIRTANVLWAPEARNIGFVNYIMMILFAGIMVLQLVSSNLFGLVGLAGMVIALPKFFYFKELRYSQLWFWRLARLIIACLVVLGVEIIGMVV